MSTKRIRNRFKATLQEGLADIPCERFARIARAVIYLTLRMERSAS